MTKVMTCRELGGECDEKVYGSTEGEMMENGMKHLDVAHPKMSADIKAMPMNDPGMVAWSEKFKVDFANAPEVAE